MSSRLSAVLVLFFTYIMQMGAQTCSLGYTLSITGDEDFKGESMAQLIDLNSNELFSCTAQGNFILTGLCSGIYTFQLHHYACKDSIFTVQLLSSKAQTLHVSHYLHVLHDVHVTAKGTEHSTILHTHTLSPSNVSMHQSFGIAQVLAQSPGISEVKNGPGISKVMIHGMQGYRVLMLQEGVRFESQAWGNDHAPEIDAFLMTRLEVVKGAASVRYGSDAIAGVVLMRSPQLPDTGTIQGLAQLQYVSNGRMPAGVLQLQGHADAKGHLAWRVHVSGKYGGTVSAPHYAIANTGQHEGNMAFQTAYHNTRWGTDIFVSRYNSSLGLYSGSHIANITDLKAAIASSVPLQPASAFSYQFQAPKQQIQHDFFKNAWHWHINEIWQLHNTWSVQQNTRGEFDVHGQNVELIPASRFRLQGFQNETVLEHQQWHHMKGQFGMQYAEQQNNTWGSTYMPNYVQHNWALFGLERLLVFKTDYGPALLEFGSRIDFRTLQAYFYRGSILQEPYQQYIKGSAQLGLQIPTGKISKVLIYSGSAWRPPSALELYANGLHHGTAAYETGSEHLDAEQVFNFQVHWTLEKGKYHCESQIYYNAFTNYIYLYPTQKFALSLRGAYPVFEYRQTQAAIYGVDVLQQFTLCHNISCNTQFTMVRGQDMRTLNPLIYIPADGIKSDIQWQNTKSHNNVVIAFGAQWVNRQWRQPAFGDFAAPPPAYVVAYLNTEYTFSWANKRFTCGLQIQNLFNQTYRSYLDRFRYYTDALGRTACMQLRIHF